MSRKRALTEKELQHEMDRIMENMSDESFQSEDNDDSVADRNYEPTDDESSGSSDINSTSSPVPAQYTNNSDDELSGNYGTNSPLPGSIAASVPTQNTDTDDGLADNAASDNMIWRIPTGKQPVLLPFTKQTGTEPHLAELLCEEPLEMFYFSLVDDPIFQYIADQTNLYATQVITSEADVSSKSRLHNWLPTNKNEIKKVFGLLSYMGLVKMPNLDQGRTTPTSVVMSLFEPILDSGRTLVTDNWYTSVDLAKRLMDRQTYLIGTLRKNRRGLPKDLVNKKLKSGEIAALENQDGVTVISWNDKRNVLVLSTKHSNTTVDTTNRRQKTVKKPEAIVAYNAGKSSVDISDQMTAYQTPLRRTFKWYRKLAVEIILNTAMVNAWIMYKESVDATIPLLQFRKAVTYKLCEAQDPLEQPDAEITPKRKRQKHEMSKSDYKKRRPCCKCYEKLRIEKGWKEARKLTRVRFYCKGCDGEPFFCLDCFNKVHRYENP